MSAVHYYLHIIARCTTSALGRIHTYLGLGGVAYYLVIRQGQVRVIGVEALDTIPPALFACSAAV